MADSRDDVEELTLKLAHALAQVDVIALASVQALFATRRRRRSDALEYGRRIAQRAVNMALVLGLQEPLLTEIELAAFLQTAQPEPHEDEVRTLVLLRNVPIIGGAIEIAAAAHERYDGSGTPLGLSGERIPIGASIIAVATAYEDLLADAPNRRMEILLSARAVHFDPHVMEALNVLVRSGRAMPAVADSAQVTTPPDPRRRTRRKRVSPIAARIGELPLEVVEVSYGGFRVESQQAVDATPSDTFRLEIPSFGFRADATWIWSAPQRQRHWCGAALSKSDPRQVRHWAALVDALPEVRPLEA